MFKRIFCFILMLLMLSASALAVDKTTYNLGQVGMLYEGQSVKMTPKLLGIHTKGTVTWKSSEAKVVNAGKSGKLTGKQEGFAVVSAMSGKTELGLCGVLVLPKKITIGVGECYFLPYYFRLSYSSSDKKIASVDEDGVIRGVKPGQTKVCVRCDNIKLNVSITVTP